jgi:uncharacterized membrane protein YozB (DUF420 family)
MQKRRPLGVTIIALWALVGSGIVSFDAILFIIDTLSLYYADFLEIFSIAGDLIVVPLGSPALEWLADLVSATFSTIKILISKISLAILYALIGFFTIRASKFAWVGNVSITIAGLVSAIVGLYYLYLEEMSTPSLSDQGFGQLFILMITINAISLPVAALRLYYLSRPHVRDFFRMNSLLVKKRTT